MFSLSTPAAFGRRQISARALAVLALAVSISLPAGVARAQSEDTSVLVRVKAADLHPRSPEAAHQLLARLEKAALEACGASEFSFPDVKLAIQRTPCWRDSVARAITQIGDPLLSQVRSQEPESGR